VSSDRTEKATPKRREDARKKGQIARRPEVSAIGAFLAALLMLRVSGNDLLHRSAQLFSTAAASVVSREPLTGEAVHGMLIQATGTLALLSLPIVAAALTAGLVGNFAQGGLSLAPEAFKPKVELLKSFLKLGGLAAACYGIFGRTIAEAPLLIGSPSARTFGALGSLIYGLGLRAGGVLFLVAALDYLYGWFKHEKSLRMTKQELKDEFRKQEGDPLTKHQRRRIARARSQRRIAAEVPRADLVITNPTHFAVALRYDRERDAAPTVVAKGADLMAKTIRELAKKHNVAIVENPPLARSLYKSVEMGQMIPAELFRAVAELLAHVYRQRERAA